MPEVWASLRCYLDTEEHRDVSTLKDKIQALNRETEYWLCYEVGGVFEWSWTLRDFEQFLIDLVVQPEIACAIMGCYTDLYISCGAIYPLIGAMADELGIDVLNPLQPRVAGMGAARIKREFGNRLSFYGAVDIQQTLPRGALQEVRAEAQERCRVLGRGGGYICASAHYIQADTPLENIVAMYTAPRELSAS